MAGKTCFVIGPIDVSGTEVYKRSDQILRHVIQPVVRGFDFEVTRADQISEPGLVTRQVMRHVMEDDLVIADLTGRNPNVYYELAVRHAIRKPLVQMVCGETTLPFDIFDTRTIFFEITDPDSLEDAKSSLGRQIEALEQDPKPLENPITETIDLTAYRHSGDERDHQVGEILEAIAGLRAQVSALAQPRQPSESQVPGALTADALRSLSQGGRIVATGKAVLPRDPVMRIARDLPTSFQPIGEWTIDSSPLRVAGVAPPQPRPESDAERAPRGGESPRPKGKQRGSTKKDGSAGRRKGRPSKRSK